MRKANNFFTALIGLSFLLSFILLACIIWFENNELIIKIFLTNAVFGFFCIMVYKTNKQKH